MNNVERKKNLEFKFSKFYKDVKVLCLIKNTTIRDLQVAVEEYADDIYGDAWLWSLRDRGVARITPKVLHKLLVLKEYIKVKYTEEIELEKYFVEKDMEVVKEFIDLNGGSK